MKRKGIIAAGLLILMAAVPSCAGFTYARIFMPAAYGLTCFDDDICVDDRTRLAEARALRDDAVAFVTERVGPFKAPPRLLFCSTTDCFAKFGNPQVWGLYFWGTGRLVVNETGWHDYIIRHELIHHWQAENFGVLPSSKGLPRWYIEGMAYVMSADPRDVIPHGPSQDHRAAFNAWLAAGNDWRVPPE